MDRVTFNLLEFYISAIVILLYLSTGLLWMFRDLFRENDTIDLRERTPKAFKNTWIGKSLFVFFLIVGFTIAVSNFVYEHVARALLIPIPFLLLARAFSTSGSHVQKRSSKGTKIITLVLLVSVAAIVRCYDISDYPPGLSGPDEIKLANDVNRMSKGLDPPLSFSPFGTPRVPSTPLALLHKFLPRCRATVRSYSILCGIVCIPAFYCLARNCLPTIWASLATILLIFSPFHNFYSRVTLGARLTILEIISIYFLITAINRRSYLRVAFAAIGASILLYDYRAARIMPIVLLLGVLTAWLGRRIKAARMILYFAIVTGVILTLLVPLCYVWTQRPDKPWFHPTVGSLNSLSQIKLGIRSSFLMFQNERYGTQYVFSQANATCLNFPLLALMIGGLLLSFVIFDVWPALFIGLCFFVALLPSGLSGVMGRAHRCIMVIPFMYILIGYSLWMLSRILSFCAGRIVSYCGLVIITVWCSIWGVNYFFQDMWKLRPKVMEGLWKTSAIRATEVAWELSKDNYQIFTGRPSRFWLYLSGVPKISSWKTSAEIAFRPKNWLPENWSDTKKAVILSEYTDGPVLNIMTQWASPYSWEEEFYPVGGTRLLIGKFGGYKRKMLAPKPILRSGWIRRFRQWDGSLMFANQYEIVLKDHTDGAKIYIDGEPWFSVGKKAIFAAGLHDVRILSAIVEQNKALSKEPCFVFEVRDLIANSYSEIRITPSMLYPIPVHGWIHTAYPVDEPSRMVNFAIEPFIFYSGIWGEKDYFPAKEIIHEWRSQVRLRRGDTLPLEVSWRRGEVDVYVDGKEMPKNPNRKSITFQLDGSEEEHAVLIRWGVVGNYLKIMLTRAGYNNQQECPPYEIFYPSANDRFRLVDYTQPLR